MATRTVSNAKKAAAQVIGRRRRALSRSQRPTAPNYTAPLPTIERLRSDLQFAAENFNCLCRCFMQIGALMHAMKEGGPHVAHLIEVAHYHADQHADLAEAMRKKAVEAAEVSP